jgi:hypothetical protein
VAKTAKESFDAQVFLAIVGTGTTVSNIEQGQVVPL